MADARLAHKLSSAGGSTWAAGNVSVRLADALLEANLTSPVANASALVAHLFASWERVRVADCASLPAAANIVSYNQPPCELLTSADAAPSALVESATGSTWKSEPLLRCPFANYELYPSARYNLKLELQLQPGAGRPTASVLVKELEVSTLIARAHSVRVDFVHY